MTEPQISTPDGPEVQKQESPALGWWNSLKDHKGDRADLCLCKVPLDVMFLPSFHQLRKRVPKAREDYLAVAAAVLANVRYDDPAAKNLAARLAAPRNGKAVFSDLRFRRLLQCEEPEDLMLQLIRAVRSVERKAPVTSLLMDICFWGDRVRQSWAFTYYEDQTP